MTRRRERSTRARPGFTLVEVLVVISVIAVLISILGVAFSGALSSSRNVATQSLLRSVQIGIEQFKTDFGYLPPLVDGSKHTLDSIDDPMDKREELINHRYQSIYSLTVYLLGVGELAPYDASLGPNDDPDRHDGVQGPGIRDPGPDRSWGGARERDNHRPPRTGRTFGPYIDIGDGEGVLRRVTQADLNVPAGAMLPDFFADGDEDGSGADGVGDLFVITDRWNRPIRYYKDWPTRQDNNGVIEPSLDLIPIELRNVQSLRQHLATPRAGVIRAETQLDQNLLRAPYALLSAGPDADFGDTDTSGNWLGWGAPGEPGANFFDGIPSTDPAKFAVIDRVADNIRNTP